MKRSRGPVDQSFLFYWSTFFSKNSAGPKLGKFQNSANFSPKPYAFEYGVEDSYSGAAFGQTETSDTKLTNGNYRVALPDGRTQIVTYTADPYGYGGYIADVKYEGHAVYPEHKPAPHPAPAYKPAPPPPAYHA